MLFAILHSFVSLHFESCNKTKKYGLQVLLQFEDTSWKYLRYDVALCACWYQEQWWWWWRWCWWWWWCMRYVLRDGQLFYFIYFFSFLGRGGIGQLRKKKHSRTAETAGKKKMCKGSDGKTFLVSAFYSPDPIMVWKKFLHKLLPTQTKQMHNLQVKRHIYAPENCPPPPLPKKIKVHPKILYMTSFNKPNWYSKFWPGTTV